jgi:hypothetical protein
VDGSGVLGWAAAPVKLCVGLPNDADIACKLVCWVCSRCQTSGRWLRDEGLLQGGSLMQHWCHARTCYLNWRGFNGA